MLAGLEAWREEHGQLPDDLGSLVPEILDAIPDRSADAFIRKEGDLELLCHVSFFYEPGVDALGPSAFTDRVPEALAWWAWRMEPHGYPFPSGRVARMTTSRHLEAMKKDNGKIWLQVYEPDHPHFRPREWKEKQNAEAKPKASARNE